MKTFNEICEIEPRLRELYEDIPIFIKPEDENFWQFWSRVKMRMSDLVGWEGESMQLRNSDCYRTAYAACLERANRSYPTDHPAEIAAAEREAARRKA